MYTALGIVIVLAVTVFRPLTKGLIRAAVLVVRPRRPKVLSATVAVTPPASTVD